MTLVAVAPLDVAYLIMAKTTWSGRALETREIGTNWEEGNQDPHWIDRFRFLVSTRGTSVAAYPKVFDHENIAPDAVLLSPQSTVDERHVEEQFDQKYRVLRHDEWRLLLSETESR